MSEFSNELLDVRYSEAAAKVMDEAERLIKQLDKSVNDSEIQDLRLGIGKARLAEEGAEDELKDLIKKIKDEKGQ